MALPLINLDDKTFEELVQEARKQIPIYAPDWTDHNIHDPGITFIELFALLTEIMLYRQDKVPDESKGKFLQLMGIKRENHNNEDEAKTLAKAILEVRKDMKTIHRAVTSEDYEYLLLNAPELAELKIARVKAIPRYHPKQHQEVPGIVTIAVVPTKDFEDTQSEPALRFLRDVYHFLNDRRLLTCELFVMFPEYIKVSVEADVVIKPQYLKETVEGNVVTALETFLSPVGGGPDGRGWPFGRPVYVSEIMKVIDAAEGVDYVSEVILNEGKNDISIHKHSLVRSGDHTINVYEEET